MLLVRTVISVLCATGFYASVFMLRKSVRAAQGGLTEPSVVETERATLFFGMPNSLFGILYYVALTALAWSGIFWAAAAALAAALLAACTSLYLAYSLLYITKRRLPVLLDCACGQLGVARGSPMAVGPTLARKRPLFARGLRGYHRSTFPLEWRCRVFGSRVSRRCLVANTKGRACARPFALFQLCRL